MLSSVGKISHVLPQALNEPCGTRYYIALGKRIQAASVLTRHPRQVGLGLASDGSCPVHHDAIL